MNPVSEILKLAAIQEPFEAPTLQDWVGVEKDLGVDLPVDFRELVTNLGTGVFGECLYLRNPRTRSKNIQLSKGSLAVFRSLLDEIEAEFNISLFPVKDGLISIASRGAISSSLIQSNSILITVWFTSIWILHRWK